MSALPHFSDIDLLGYGELVINLDSEIADHALDLHVAQQKLNRSKISCFLVDQRCLGSAEPVRAIEAFGSRPIIASHFANSLAYCRVLRCFARPRPEKGLRLLIDRSGLCEARLLESHVAEWPHSGHQPHPSNNFNSLGFWWNANQSEFVWIKVNLCALFTSIRTH